MYQYKLKDLLFFINSYKSLSDYFDLQKFV